MANIDVLIKVQYPLEAPENTTIRTNAKPERTKDILADWLRAQLGQGKDNSTPAEKDIYSIEIGLDLSCDGFSTTSDTNNKSLTCGIMRDVIARLDSISIQALS